jgi:hypothetical protein
MTLRQYAPQHITFASSYGEKFIRYQTKTHISIKITNAKEDCMLISFSSHGFDHRQGKYAF